MTEIPDLPVGQNPPDYWPVFHTQLAGDEHQLGMSVGESDAVFMVGLFSSHPGRAQPQPVYRFGNVALLPREPITIALPGAVKRDIEAYLIEAHSWGGQSGSPVFIAGTHPMIHNSPTVAGTTVSPVVLGFLQGHFDIPRIPQIEQAEEHGYESAVEEFRGLRVPINAGMAIVVPAERITEMLMGEEYVGERHRRLASVDLGADERDDRE